ncbi:MAG TPA: hypothetical protein VGE12_20115 [Noviherbaspirillum sp.]
MYNYQRRFPMTTVLVALAVLGAAAGCDGAGVAERNSKHVAEISAESAATSHGHADASVAEVRHFEIYNRYRTVFDDAADPVPLHMHPRSDIRPALEIRDDIQPTGAPTACFLATHPAGD